MRYLVIAVALVLAGCGGTLPAPTTATTAAPTAVASPTFDSAYFTARAAAQQNGEAIVGAWRLYESGTVDEATFRQTVGIFLDDHLGWMDRYAAMTFDHRDLDGYSDAIDSVLDALGRNRDAARAFGQLYAAVEDLAP